jgi:hypothetical protein
MRQLFFLLTIFFLSAGVAHAADGSLFVSPEQNVYAVGESFSVKVFADTGGSAISAAEANLTFDPGVLAVEDISTEGSILGSWPTEPSFSNTVGTVQFAGWARDRYAGTDGLLITITFKALRNDAGAVRFVSGAMLAADSQGTNIITSMRSAAYTIQPSEEVPVPADAGEARASPADLSSSVLQPVFVEYPREVQVGERIIAKGQAAANARVSVWLQRGEDKPQQAAILSSADGSFTFVAEGEVQAGEYRLWAQAIDQEGIRSATSSIAHITAGQPSSLAAAAALTGILPGSAIYLLLVGILGFAAGYYTRRRMV